MDRVGVEVWLKEYGIKNYTINEDLSVDVNGVVNLVSVGLVVLLRLVVILIVMVINWCHWRAVPLMLEDILLVVIIN